MKKLLDTNKNITEKGQQMIKPCVSNETPTDMHAHTTVIELTTLQFKHKTLVM